jgi:hypothetical protein
MPGIRKKVIDRSAARKRRLFFGLPIALAVAVGGGLAFADAVPTPSPGSSSAGSAPVNGAAPVNGTVASSAPSMMSSSTISANISVSTVKLATAFSYLSPSSTGIPQWTRTVTAMAPNGTLEVAWQASDSVHVTPVNRYLRRTGADVVIAGAHEIGGLVAFDNGFALLTRVSDHNKWGETAAALIRVRNGRLAFVLRLTGSASHDTSPMLNGQLSWNGSRYAAYFTVHGTSGSTNGSYGDKMVYANDSGQMMSGGWEWGCRGDTGRTLSWQSGSYSSACFDDSSSSGTVGGSSDMVQSGNGRSAVALSSLGPVTSKKNSLTWKVTPRWNTHQVVVVFLAGSSSRTATSVFLTSDASTDNINVHLAPYGKSALLVSWESVKHGVFTGTHFRLIDLSGRFLTADVVLTIHVSGNIVVLSNGDLVWAFVRETPVYSHRLSRWPTTTSLFLAHLRVTLS